MKNILCIDHIERDIKLRRDPPRLHHRVWCAASVGIFFAGFAPQTKHHPYHIIALLLEQGRGYGGIHSSRHGNDNFLHKSNQSNWSETSDQSIISTRFILITSWLWLPIRAKHQEKLRHVPAK